MIMSGRVETFNSYNNTSAAVAQTVEAMMDAEVKRYHDQIEEEQKLVAPKKQLLQRESAAAKVKASSGISVLAVVGTALVVGLMLLVVLAQINHNEIAIETARLSVEVRELAETQRALSIAFESSINIREVERIARDELGMSRPDAAQMITIHTPPRDRAFVIYNEYDYDSGGFMDFITSLFEYFR